MDDQLSDIAPVIVIYCSARCVKYIGSDLGAFCKNKSLYIGVRQYFMAFQNKSMTSRKPRRSRCAAFAELQ